MPWCRYRSPARRDSADALGARRRDRRHLFYRQRAHRARLHPRGASCNYFWPASQLTNRRRLGANVIGHGRTRMGLEFQVCCEVAVHERTPSDTVGPAIGGHPLRQPVSILAHVLRYFLRRVSSLVLMSPLPLGHHARSDLDPLLLRARRARLNFRLTAAAPPFPTEIPEQGETLTQRGRCGYWPHNSIRRGFCSARHDRGLHAKSLPSILCQAGLSWTSSSLL